MQKLILAVFAATVLIAFADSGTSLADDSLDQNQGNRFIIKEADVLVPDSRGVLIPEEFLPECEFGHRHKGYYSHLEPYDPYNHGASESVVVTLEVRHPVDLPCHTHR